MQVIGQMANGTLGGESNNLLLTPIEDTVREIQTEFEMEQRRVAAALDLGNSNSSRELRDLTELTREGVNTWEYFASWFGDSTLETFTNEQAAGLISYQAEVDSAEHHQERLGSLVSINQALSTAQDAFRYERLRTSGNEREADLLAVRMLQSYGPLVATRAPEVWRDLGMSFEPPASGETVFQRLHREGLAESPTPPEIRFGSHEGFQDGVAILSNDLDETNVDSVARQSLALLAIDSDPALSEFSANINDLQSQLPALQQLVSAGVAGTRTAPYVGGVQQMVQEFQEVYDRMNIPDPETGVTPAKAARQSLDELKKALTDMDPDIRNAVSERIDAMEKMLEFLDPNSQSGKDMQLMFEQVNSNDFDESTFMNWLKSDGFKTLGAIAIGVGAAVAVASLGPFAVAVAGVAGGIIGYEAVAEALFQLRNNDYLDTGERTGARTFHAMRGGLNMGADGHAVDATVQQALKEHGIEFLQGTILALATMGAGHLLGRTITAIRNSSTSGLSANSASLGRLAGRVNQVEQAAERVGGRATLERWMASFSSEFREEIVEEAIGQSAEIGMEQLLGDVNPVLSVMSSALIANRKMQGGFDVQAHRGGNIEILVDAEANRGETMEALQQQLLSDGLLVEWDGNHETPMKVTTPEGEVLTLTSKTSSDEITADNADTSVDSAGDGNLDFRPDTNLDPDLDQLDGADTDSGTASASSPSERRHQQIKDLVETLNAPDLTAEQTVEIESQIKEVLMEQARDYAR
ncbi:MAG: hypothetical protein K8F91_01050, partial [Candidatus Obscuribacterales bacterium]|nr:hypothetical protein [Candidatus Obscuribacterales bacterium]